MAQTRVTAQGATATNIRSGRTKIKKISVRPGSTTASRVFLQVFDSNSPTVGTTEPIDVLRVPAGDAAVQAPWEKYIFASSYGGKDYPTGLSIAVTTTPTGASGPSAGAEPEVIVDWEPLG